MIPMSNSKLPTPKEELRNKLLVLKKLSFVNRTYGEVDFLLALWRDIEKHLEECITNVKQ